MSEKHESETLKQQRLAREEFLNLKKMQAGEIGTGPKPSDVAIVPKTAGEKFANFWYHYKWAVIIGIVISVILAVVIAQCAGRTNYDLEVVLYSYQPVSDADTDKMEKYFEKYGEDVNGDGEVHIQVINCSFSKNSADNQYKMAMSSKLQAVLAADSNALLFITDKETYDYLNNIPKDSKLFEGEPLEFSEKFYKSFTSNGIVSVPEGLQISCRTTSNSTISKDKNIEKYYKASQKILEGLKNDF